MVQLRNMHRDETLVMSTLLPSMVDRDYLSVRIPRKLATEVDRLADHKVLGFRSRAEFVVDAI